jgi:hypothetical protein
MIYTNDNTDRKQRRQHYVLTVYILPVFVAVMCCAVIYFTTRFYNLDDADKKFGYLLSVAIGFIVWFKNKFKWLPLPDGSHYYINKNQDDENMTFDRQANITEPSNYDMIFRYSKVDSAITLICGIILTALGFYIMKTTSVIFPLLVIMGGLFMLVQGYKTFVDTTPKLKLSKQGLWTQKLGFHAWSSIKKTKIVRQRSYRSTQTSLEIYLVDGRFKNVDYPDETLSLSGIKDSNKIEKLINEFNS